MKKSYLFFYSILLMLILSVSYADKSAHKHWCYKPEKPIFAILIAFGENYKKDLTVYQKCLKNYIKEQNKEILLHQNNIHNAFEELKQSVGKAKL